MIRENLVAERIAIEKLSRRRSASSATRIPPTRSMLEGILATEEEHADEPADLLNGTAARPASQQARRDVDRRGQQGGVEGIRQRAMHQAHAAHQA